MSYKTIYVDTNAAEHLWDKYVKFQPEGNSSIDISKTPFNKIVTSFYAIDELLIVLNSNHRNQNAIKKHIAFLTIFQKIPVVKCFTEIVNETPSLIRINLENYLIKSNVMSGMVSNLIISMASGKNTEPIQRMIDNKRTARIVAASHVKHKNGMAQYYPLPKRINFEDYARKIILIPDNITLTDFHLFNMFTYAKYRDRMFKKPQEIKIKDFYKSSKYALNQQIDFYHLCYARYVDLFITDDKALRWFAEKYKEVNLIDCDILNSEEYFKIWLRSLLINKEI